MPDVPTFTDDRLLRVGTTDFYCAFPLDDVPDGCLGVMKERELVERYIALSREFRPKIVVELGIRRGGSTALLTELTQPDRLIAVELGARPAPALRDYVEQRDLTDRVRPYYGVDQSDRARLSQILADELGGRPIDLVVDDASHLYAETRSSFETLFPLLRPGAQFVLEDWNADHLVADGIAHAAHDLERPDHDEIAQYLQDAHTARIADPALRVVSLTQLAVEFLVARASSGDVIREVTIDEHWVTVRRGADALDPATFRLSDLVHDHFGFTATP